MVVAVRTTTAVMAVAAATSRPGWSTCPIRPRRRHWVGTGYEGNDRGLKGMVLVTRQ